MLSVLKRVFLSNKKIDLLGFSEMILLEKCFSVKIFPTISENRRSKRIKYILFFSGEIPGKPGITYHELYTSSCNKEDHRKNKLQLFLYAERRMRELNEILPDLEIMILDGGGKQISHAGINAIRAEAHMRNAAILF